MRTRDDLERLWSAQPRDPRGRGTVRLLCLRKGGGVHEQVLVAELTPTDGVVGDRWRRDPRATDETQVTLMSMKVATLLADPAPLDAAGDNLLVDLDLSVDALPVGARLRVGTALLEVSSKPHTGCRKFATRYGLEALAWVNARPERRLRGVNCRVVEGGVVMRGDVIERV